MRLIHILDIIYNVRVTKYNFWKKKEKRRLKDDVRTTMTKTHRGELVLSDLPQDRIYGFVPNGYAQSIKITG